MSTMKTFRLSPEAVEILRAKRDLYGSETQVVERALRKLKSPVKNFLTEKSGGFNNGVVNSASPVSVNVKKALKRPATDGYVYSVNGSIKVVFNGEGGNKITLDAAEEIGIATVAKNIEFQVETIKITTTSAIDVNFRLFLI